jgi:hypothetical protein
LELASRSLNPLFLGIFDKYLWHSFVIFSFSWNLFFLEVVQPVIQRRIGKGNSSNDMRLDSVFSLLLFLLVVYTEALWA